MIELTLPWPPSVNRYWRSVTVHGARRVLLSADGRKFRDAVAAIVRDGGIRKQTGALSVKCILHCPDWRVRDIDNVGKALYDSLVHAGAIDGDEFICLAVSEKRRSADKAGRVVVRIQELKDGVEVKPSGAWLN
ncbi:MAG: RusA family crossover junction endodeoxyribonuclease [Planctomycetes bacterium]|nr:RusA family crossover junction endodeoxyribonuclease [Planctomycetota bacterium]MCD7897473.1 RusA family crossover junction endodeoxyribonuclease [Planctomycetaceae bacterium]